MDVEIEQEMERELWDGMRNQYLNYFGVRGLRSLFAFGFCRDATCMDTL